MLEDFVSHTKKKILDRPFKILVRLCLKKLYQKACLCKRRIQTRHRRISLTDKELLRKMKVATGIVQILDQFENRERPCFYWSRNNRQEIIKVAEKHYQESISQAIREADEVSAHSFDLLGSGKVSLGPQINWHLDFKSGYCWPVKFYRDMVQIYLQNDSDAKVPRELSRCQHFVTLGRAYCYTQNEEYAKEFVAQLSDWMEENPPWMGINWCSPMEAAIRLVNWIWAFHFFEESQYLSQEVKKAFLKSVYLHAKFISENLEYYGEFSNNHYLSDIVGLLIFSLLFPEFKAAKKWKEFALQDLFTEIEKQVHEDGMSFEGSTSYHRLAVELFCTALVLCRRNAIDIPQPVWQRLEKMFEYTLYYSRPDGLCPQIGDTDNGRLLILGFTEVLDHRYLLAIGAVLFRRGDFKKAAGFFHEDALWLLGKEGFDTFEAIPAQTEPLASRGFAAGGVYFLRNKQLYMAVDCGPNGRKGRGDHSHNDTLSFEIYAHDKAFIIDPGTYVYTADHLWRNKFRSTAFHNTVTVDGKEMNRIVPEQLFESSNDAIPKVDLWVSTPEFDLLDAEHSGYARLQEPVIHRRQFYFAKTAHYWVVRDLLRGSGQHQLCWYFHFGRGITLRQKGDLTIETLCVEGANLILQAVCDEAISLELKPGWVSPSYGLKERAQVAKFSGSAVLPTSISFLLYPHFGRRTPPSLQDDILREFERARGTVG